MFQLCLFDLLHFLLGGLAYFLLQLHFVLILEWFGIDKLKF